MKQRKIPLFFVAWVTVLWIQLITVTATNQFKIFVEGKEQKVTEAKVEVDGKRISLQTPAYITNGRIVVPLRFLGEALGADVKWDDTEKRVKVISLTREIELWLDRDKMNINGTQKHLDQGSIPRLVNYGKKEYRTVVPLRAIGEALGYQVSFDPATYTGILKKTTESKPENNQDLNSSPSVTIGGQAGSTIEKAELMVYNGKVVLRMNGINAKKVKVSKLENPNRVIYDIEDTVFSPGKWEFLPISYDNIEKIRIAQFQSGNGDGKNTTRVVFDVVKLVNIDELLYFFEDNSLQIDIRSIESMTKEKIQDTSHASKNPDKEKEKDNTTIIEPSKENTAAEEKKQEQDWKDEVARRLNKMTLLPLGERIESNKYVHILIDPGHGGRDPGTISFNGRYEKDFALKASLKLRDDLQQMGYIVHMTRETDRYPTLIERAKQANGLLVDIFISIHANSVDPNRGPNGIEVWYSRENKIGSYTGLEKELARTVKNALIRTTNAVDRGIKREKHVVTSKSKMAAILVEAGFLSNPIEEALLFNEDYVNVVSRAIAVSVDNFVADNRKLLSSSKESMIAAQTATPIDPTVSSKKVKYKVNADALNVRENPGLDQPTIGKVYEGEIVTVEYGVEEIKRDGYTWLYTTDNSGHINGWLAKEFLIEQQ